MARKLTDDKRNDTDTGFGENERMIEEIQMITQGYDCLQLICINQERTYNDLYSAHLDYFKKPKIIILDFWKMYHHAKENNIVQQIISAIRLIKKDGKLKSYGHSKLSFTVELVCRKIEKKSTNTSENEKVHNKFDILIRLELIALDMKLLQHVDSVYLHVPTGTAHPHEVNLPNINCPGYHCLCKEEGWTHGNSGNMSSWSLINILARGRGRIGGLLCARHPLSIHQSG